MSQKHNTPTSWSAVAKAQNISEVIPFDVSMLPKAMGKYLIAAYKLPYIIKEINADWIVDYKDGKQYKYHIWWEIIKDKQSASGSGLSYDFYAYWVTSTLVGVRFAFCSEAAGKFCAENFKDVWEDFILINGVNEIQKVVGEDPGIISASINNVGLFKSKVIKPFSLSKTLFLPDDIIYISVKGSEPVKIFDSNRNLFEGITTEIYDEVISCIVSN